MVPHKVTVRTYSLITSITKSLFRKKREKQFIMAKKTTNDMPEVVKSKEFEGFTIVKDEKGKFNIVVGNALISNKKFASPEKAEGYIATKPYELIFNTMFYIIDQKTKQHETAQKENQTNAANNQKN